MKLQFHTEGNVSLPVISIRGKIFLFLGILTLLFVLPALLHSQWITGPLVNALLLVAAVLLGPLEAVVLGLLPSTVAMSFGLLPLPLAPAIPVIVLGNAALALTFTAARRWGFFPAAGLAALAQFLVIYVGALHLLASLFRVKLAEDVAIMLSWPQLVTALAGGLLAWMALSLLKHRDR